VRHLIALGCGLAVLSTPAVASGATGDPAANRTLSEATVRACQTARASAACEADALSDLDAARAAEGIGPMQLPGDFGSLTIPEQLLVLSNLERVDRGLVPVIGLSAPLDQDATTAAQQDRDPLPTNFYGNVATSNWEGGYPSPFEADFVWMYDDGVGSGNIDCTPSNQSGCWGHRHDILWPFDAPVVMGAGTATAGQFGASETELFVGGDRQTAPGRPDAPLDPTWATIAATLPFTVSPASLTFAPSQSSATLTISASGESMPIAASLSPGADGWSVTPSGCTAVAGSSCTLTVLAAPTAGGTEATLTLHGPHGAQSVALAKQGAATLRAMANRRTITLGRAATITATLLRAAALAAAGQVVTLAQTASGVTSTVTVARATTSPTGTVSFRVRPRVNTTFRLAFAGNTTLAGTSAMPVVIAVAPRIAAAFSHGSVRRGARARLSGRVTPASRGRRLALQLKRRRRWVNVASARMDRSGRFHFVLRPRHVGRATYRVLLAATATNVAGTSPTRTLRAT
jgi:hypothetical protein